jgi:hypothetical protein
LLPVTVAGIAIGAALTGHPHEFTVAVAAQSPPAVAAMVQADGKAAGLQITTVTTTDRADAVRLVEQGNATAAVVADPEIIWKIQPETTLQPVLAAAVQQAVVTQRAASLGLSASTAARLLAPPASAPPGLSWPRPALSCSTWPSPFTGAGWVTLLSVLPPTALIMMPLRISLVNVPAWQVIIAVVFTLAAIYGLFRMGARLYRNAILHTGARLHLGEAWRGEQVPHDVAEVRRNQPGPRS